MASNPFETDLNRIDKLITATIELRTTMRLRFAGIEISFPLMVGLLTFVTVESFSTSAKVDRLGDQVTSVRTDFVRLAERQDRLEHAARP